MFKFLFRRSSDAAPTPETQREVMERALGEVNEVLAALEPKPAVTIDPATGQVSFDLPERFPDEALALPAPAADELSESASPEPKDELERPEEEKLSA